MPEQSRRRDGPGHRRQITAGGSRRSGRSTPRPGRLLRIDPRTNAVATAHRRAPEGRRSPRAATRCGSPTRSPGPCFACDPARGRRSRAIPVGVGVTAIAGDRDAVWVANVITDTVSRLDPQTPARSSQVVPAAFPHNLATTAAGVGSPRRPRACSRATHSSTTARCTRTSSSSRTCRCRVKQRIAPRCSGRPTRFVSRSPSGDSGPARTRSDIARVTTRPRPPPAGTSAAASPTPRATRRTHG